MKILISIPHYFNPEGNKRHGSGSKNADPRIRALALSLLNIHALFGNYQYMIDIFNKIALPTNQKTRNEIDIVICTTGDKHILNRLNLPNFFYTNTKRDIDNSMLLGFECQKVLAENLGKYDYYCFMEDDLIINDPLFFEKLIWLNKSTDNINLFQPNRYEISIRDNVLKTYVDGDIRVGATEKHQNINEYPELKTNFLNGDISFKRASNPHSGCYFLNNQQMEFWTKQPNFLDMDLSFISPLESAASLGIMKTFRVYKPTSENANFLEIMHYGSAFASLLGNQIPIIKG